MTSTSPSSRVVLGGSGGNYDGYVSKTSGRKFNEEDNGPDRRFQTPHFMVRLQKEDEVFLFMVKEPVRSILSKLMDLLQISYQKPIIPLNDVAIVSGPLGYRASIRDSKPSRPTKKKKGLLKTNLSR